MIKIMESTFQTMSGSGGSERLRCHLGKVGTRNFEPLAPLDTLFLHLESQGAPMNVGAVASAIREREGDRMPSPVEVGQAPRGQEAT